MSDYCVPDPAIVWRDQSSGRTLSCLNCGIELGGRHDVLCYAYAIERTKARRAAESGGSTETADREPHSTAQQLATGTRHASTQKAGVAPGVAPSGPDNRGT